MRIPSQRERLRAAKNALIRLHEAVKGLEQLWDDNKEMNDEVDIASVIPSSLDEWETELYFTIEKMEEELAPH